MRSRSPMGNMPMPPKAPPPKPVGGLNPAASGFIGPMVNKMAGAFGNAGPKMGGVVPKPAIDMSKVVGQGAPPANQLAGPQQRPVSKRPVRMF